MAEIVNLRMARKARAREQAVKQADEKRAKFGQSKSEGKLAQREAERAARVLEAAKRESGEDKSD